MNTVVLPCKNLNVPPTFAKYLYAHWEAWPKSNFFICWKSKGKTWVCYKRRETYPLAEVAQIYHSVQLITVLLCLGQKFRQVGFKCGCHYVEHICLRIVWSLDAFCFI